MVHLMNVVTCLSVDRTTLGVSLPDLRSKTTPGKRDHVSLGAVHHDPSDLGSLLLIQITPKERTLYVE